jgi:hypothetical protein
MSLGDFWGHDDSNLGTFSNFSGEIFKDLNLRTIYDKFEDIFKVIWQNWGLLLAFIMMNIWIFQLY